jgi:hypothetical protein
LDDRVVRLPQGSEMKGLDPSISPGSLMLLEKVPRSHDPRSEARKAGWGRSIYTLRRGAEFLLGHLERDGNQYALLSNTHGSVSPIKFRHDELVELSRVSGVAVPV